MKKWLLTFVLCVGFGLLLLAWLAVEDARQAVLLDIRVLEAENRALRLQHRRDQYHLFEQDRLPGSGIVLPKRDTAQAARESQDAWQEFETLRLEQRRRKDSWHARLLDEARRRTGW